MLEDDKKLKIFQDKLNKVAYLTDYSYIRGVQTAGPFGTTYFTKSMGYENQVYCFGGHYQTVFSCFSNTDSIGARLTLPVSAIPKETLNTQIIRNDGTNYLYFGEYPQTVANPEIAPSLEWETNMNYLNTVLALNPYILKNFTEKI